MWGSAMNEDEKLSGFIDRELENKELADMEALIARDAQAQARVSRMQGNDRLVRAAFDTPMEEAVPDRFLAAIDAGLAAHANSPSTPVETRASNDNGRAWWRMGGAVAASLAVGLFFGTQMAPTGGDATISIAMNDALNATPSAQTVSFNSGERLTPQLTFARAGGGYCRQFSMAASDGNRTGVACKSDGQWRVEALLPAGAVASAEDGYVTAEGPAAAGLDAVIGKLRTGDALDKAAEATLIERRWK
jgi:anti-sigma factor RsiW